jgi:hypothetical protein
VIGINALIGTAANDPVFCRKLLVDRKGTIAASGILLTPTELAILDSVDDGALLLMIKSAREAHRRRPFVRPKAVPEDMKMTGIMPDRPPTRTRGISPDRPPQMPPEAPPGPWEPPDRETF